MREERPRGTSDKTICHGVCVCVCVCVCVFARTHTRSCTHARTHTHTQLHTCTHARMRACTHARERTHSKTRPGYLPCAPTGASACTLPASHACARAHTHTHTHTHTQDSHPRGSMCIYLCRAIGSQCVYIYVGQLQTSQHNVYIPM